MVDLDEETVAEALSSVLSSSTTLIDGLDEDLVHYMAGLLSEVLSSSEESHATKEAVLEVIGPFLESVQCPADLVDQATNAVLELVVVLPETKGDGTTTHSTTTSTTTRRLQQGIVTMSSDLTSNPTATSSSSSSSYHELETNKYLWNGGGGGTSVVPAMANTLMEAHRTKSSAKDRRKQKQELEKVRRDYQQQQQQASASTTTTTTGVVSSMVLPDYSSGRNERDIQVRDISLSLDNGTSLLDHGDLKLAYRRRYGLVGKNGVGKTTLLKAIAAMELEGFPRHLRVLHVRQELKSVGNDTPVLQAVLQADVERLALLQQEQEILQRLEKNDETQSESTTTTTTTTRSTEEADKGPSSSVKEKRERLLKQQQKTTASSSSFQQDLIQLDQVYARLQVLSADSAEARAAMILSGLQFTNDMQRGPTSALSGGWRMRVALAAALFIEPDLLMLDEPTNHLDLEAVLWLEEYLVDYKHTLIVVSHDRSFLNEVCTDIVEFKKLKLTYYRGNYDSYVKTADEKVKNTMRVYQAYQDKRAHLMEFIEKFRANAKRASMVQSRIKTVEKMDAEAPEPVEMEQVWRFSIPNPEPLGRPIISVDDVTFDYTPVGPDGEKKPESEFLLQKVNFGVDLSSRIGILGANGAGKSTLLNLILGLLESKKGSVSRNGRLRIGHFTQHSADKFNLQLSSVENMLNLFDDAEDQEMRSFLGRFQIQGSDALKPMFLLSGGQKSRVAFATLAYQKPHVIVMDEPTNHLDMESIDALVAAVQDYRGGLMVVSHDQFFITNTCRELWVVGEGHATRFRGDFDEYKKATLEKTRKRVEASVKLLSTINN